MAQKMSDTFGMKNLDSQSHEVLDLGDVETASEESNCCGVFKTISNCPLRFFRRLQGIIGRRRTEILFMVIFSVLLPLADEGSDLYSAIRYFYGKELTKKDGTKVTLDGTTIIKTDPIFGGLTLGITFLPMLFSLVIRRSWHAFGNFPLAHIFKNWDRCQAKLEMLKKVDKMDKRIMNAESDKEKKQCEILKEKCERDIEEFDAKFTAEKGFQAIFESLPQYILQSAIVSNEIEQKDKLSYRETILKYGIFALASGKVTDPLKIFQLVTSFASILVTFYTMTIRLKIQISNQSSRPAKMSTKKTIWIGFLLFWIIFMKLIVLGSTFLYAQWKTATIIFSIKLPIILIPTGIYLLILSRKITDREIKSILILNWPASLLTPVMGIFEAKIILTCGFLSNVFGTLPDIIFASISLSSNNRYGGLEVFGIVMIVLIVTMLLVAFLSIPYFFLEHALKSSNIPLKIKTTIEEKDLATLKTIYNSHGCCQWLKHFFNGHASGMKNNIPHISMTPFIYAAVKNFPDGIKLFLDTEQLDLGTTFCGKKKTMNFNAKCGIGRYDFEKIEALESAKNHMQEALAKPYTNEVVKTHAQLAMTESNNLLFNQLKEDKYFGKTAMMIAAMDKNVPVLETLLTESEEVFLDWNLTDDVHQMSAFILSCQPGDDDQKTEEIVRLFIKNAQNQDIDLYLEDANGKKGFDYLQPELIEKLKIDFPDLIENTLPREKDKTERIKAWKQNKSKGPICLQRLYVCSAITWSIIVLIIVPLILFFIVILQSW